MLHKQAKLPAAPTSAPAMLSVYRAGVHPGRTDARASEHRLEAVPAVDAHAPLPLATSLREGTAPAGTAKEAVSAAQPKPHTQGRATHCDPHRALAEVYQRRLSRQIDSAAWLRLLNPEATSKPGCWGKCSAVSWHARSRSSYTKSSGALALTCFFPPCTNFSGYPRAAPVHCELRHQRGCRGSAGRQAAGHRRARVVQDVLQRRCLCARHGCMDWRRPEQSGSKRVLHSHTQQAPPPPVPDGWQLLGAGQERARLASGRAVRRG